MGERPKQYYLYLDESGNFEEDPADKQAPPSLIGGVFGEASAFSEKRTRKFLAQLAEDPELLAESGRAPLAVNHCEELPDEWKVPLRLRVIQWCAGQGMQFVFFRSGVKVKIVDSTQTYLNFLAEGLAQFMAALSYQGSAKLTVCIGRRVDMAAYERNPGMGRQPIPKEEYQNLIEARIAIAKARYLFDASNQIDHEIVFDRDKENDFLILSDYVCSCRYTLDYAGGPTWQDYEEPAADGRTRRAVLEELFQTRGREIGLLEERLQQDVRRSLSRRDWGGALFLALSQGEPGRGLEEELQEALRHYNDQDQQAQMTMFFNLVSLLHTRGGGEETVSLLEAYLSVLDRLPVGQDSLRSFCRVNARLYLAAAYTHRGRTSQASGQLDLCEAALPELLRQPENMDLYYLLRNRQAVIWQDCYRYDKALELLKEALAAAELQRESQESLFDLLGYSAQYQPSEQQAKLLGSLALTYQYILPSRPQLAGEARDAARRAIEAMRLPQDKRRHHMTLAEIELRCGQVDEAHRQFCAGLDCGPEAMLETLEKSANPYDWYHAICLADGLCRGSKEQRALAQKLFELIHSQFGRVFERAVYPAHSAARRAGMLCQKLGKGYAKLAQEYFQKCESLCFQGGQDALYAIGLASLASRIGMGLRGGERVDTLERQFREQCAKAEKAAQIPELQAFFRTLAQESEICTDKKKFYQSVSDRVGH